MLWGYKGDGKKIFLDRKLNACREVTYLVRQMIGPDIKWILKELNGKMWWSDGDFRTVG